VLFCSFTILPALVFCVVKMSVVAFFEGIDLYLERKKRNEFTST